MSFERPEASAGRFAFLALRFFFRRAIRHHSSIEFAMSLSSVGNPAWDSIRGVRFAMLYGPTLVAVLVTHAALDEIELASPGVGEHLACFNKHRDALEKTASAKHQRGQLEEGGVVIVQAGDLKLERVP